MAHTIPNFDAMGKEELLAFWAKYTIPTKEEAEKLIGDPNRDCSIIASVLANYAFNKAYAIQYRLEGDIQSAILREEQCDLTYERLSPDLRW